MPRARKPPRLYARGNRWVILDGPVEHGTGVGTDDRRAAEAALAAYIARKHVPVSGESDLRNIPVCDVIARYLSEHAPHVKRPDWLAGMAVPLINWWGDKKLSSIKAAACRAYTETRLSQGLSIATARHELQVLSAAINHYHREHGPLAAVPIVTLPPKPGPRERWLTRSEAARLLKVARRTPHVARLILIGLRTGTRTGAIRTLRWVPSVDAGFVDVDHGVIHRAMPGEAQTKKRKPPIRIPQTLLPHLRRWRDADLDQGIVDVIHWKGRRPQKLRRSWTTARKAAGLGPEVSPHVLRHTAVTWLLQRGVPTWEVSGFVGMSEGTVRDVYGHHSPDHFERAARAR